MHSALRPPTIRKTTLYNGCTVSYTDEGRGVETLLFIHGLGTYSSTWQKNIAVLRHQYRCIAIDLPGNGYSATGDFPYTMDFFARCIIDFIGRLDLKRVTLAGHSMGGQIALTAALLVPACCERIILCAPAGFETFSVHEQMIFKASLNCMSWLSGNEQSIQHLVRSSFHRLPNDARRLEKALVAIAQGQPQGHYKMMTDRCVEAMMAESVSKQLPLIEQPVLVIFGEQDALIPNALLHPVSTAKWAVAAVRNLPQGTLHLVPSCGHFVQWECADNVNAAIVRWMSERRANQTSSKLAS